MGLHVQKFLKYCKNQRRLSPDTVKAYGLDLKGFEEFLLSMEPPVMDCSRVTRQVLQEYVDYLNGTFAVKTVRRRIASLRSFYNYLEGEEQVTENPFERFHLHVREPFRIPQTMSLEEVNQILACAYGEAPTLTPPPPGLNAKTAKSKKNCTESEFQRVYLAQGHCGIGIALCRRLSGQRALQTEIRGSESGSDGNSDQRKRQ